MSANYSVKTKWTPWRPEPFEESGGPLGWTWHMGRCGLCLFSTGWMYTTASAEGDLGIHMAAVHSQNLQSY